MKKKPIRIKRKGFGSGGSSHFSYFRKPLNIVLITLFAAGILMVSAAQGIHPVISTNLTNTGTNYVSGNIINTTSGFAIYPNQTTDFSFGYAENTSIHYYIYAIVRVKVTPNPSAPSGYRMEIDILGHGDATNGTIARISGKSLAFPVEAFVSISSQSGGNFQVNVQSVTVFNTTLTFYPPLSIAGLAMATGSLILIATVTGMKKDDI